MKHTTYRKKLEQKIKKRDDITIKYQTLHYWFWKYTIGTIASKKRGKTLYIRTGIHGEEIWWPLSILGAINQIIDYANKKNIGLIIHPLANPAGFENHTRYSDKKNPPKNGNNNVIIYELPKRKYSDDMGEKDISKWWYWSDQKEKDLPPEGIFTIKELQKNIKNLNIIWIIDIHQDYITPTKESFAYHYGFENTNIYDPIIQKIKKLCKLYPKKAINAWFKNKITNKKTTSKWKWIIPDKKWRITRHDWTLGAAAYKLWIHYNVTCETTGSTPYKIAKKINIAWICWLIDIATKK